MCFGVISQYSGKIKEGEDGCDAKDLKENREKQAWNFFLTYSYLYISDINNII